MTAFNGLGLHLGNLSRLSNAKTRSISPENFTGAPGQGGRATEGTGASPARSLGQGWKVSQSVCVNPGRAFNCYWEMPFRRRCKVTLTNMDEVETRLYYQIDYTLTHVA